MMRKALLLALAAPVLLTSLPSAAQSLDDMDERVDRLEGQMRAVQRKVFPGGNENYFKPEITAPETRPGAPGVPASNPLSDLAARVDSLESQLTTLTGQIEQNSFKVRQLEATMKTFQSDTQFRLTQLEGGAPPPAEGTTPPVEGAAPTAPFAAPPAATGTEEAPPAEGLDPVEGEYRAAYGHVVAKDWAAAESALQAFVEKHPDSPRASSAQYWLGRSYYADGQPVQAARALLENYQTRPEGERAPESLLWLGKSLMAFSTPSPDKACEAYAQLETSYGSKLSAELKSQLAEARTAAKCK